MRWIRESTYFEALKDVTPPENVHEAMAIDLYDKIETGNLRRSLSPSPTKTQESDPIDNPPVELSDSTSVGSPATTVTVDRRLLLDLCTKAPASTAKQMLLSTL
jgi:hypothetical protein